MNEKIYQTVGKSGALNLAVGILTVVCGVAAGVLLIVSGARLLLSKKHFTI